MTNDLVTVVIPAYNAIATLDDTLRSARAQTHANLEILVIDDGSTDGTLQIANRHAREDPRIRVIQQARGGHCAARNRGIAEARGELIAPLDADDLWRPTKIARQVEALRKGGDRVGLVYTWFALIDGEGRVRSVGHQPVDSGDVLRACCQRNLVGNGSGALMRKSAILECGGYDATLRERNAQGCEDLKLYTAIAGRYHYALVPEHLTGYRETNDNMSSDVLRMKRSIDIVLAELEGRHPQYSAELREMRTSQYHWLFARGIVAGRLADSLQLIRALWQLDRSLTLRSIVMIPKLLATRSWHRTGRPLARGLLGREGGFSVPRFLADQVR